MTQQRRAWNLEVQIPNRIQQGLLVSARIWLEFKGEGDANSSSEGNREQRGEDVSEEKAPLRGKESGWHDRRREDDRRSGAGAYPREGEQQSEIHARGGKHTWVWHIAVIENGANV